MLLLLLRDFLLLLLMVVDHFPTPNGLWYGGYEARLSITTIE